MAKAKLSSEAQVTVIEIGNRITERREAIGMKACELARLVGISEITLSRIENGKIATSCTILVEIAKVLKASLSELQPTELDEYSEITAETGPLVREMKKLAIKKRKEVANHFIQTIKIFGSQH